MKQQGFDPSQTPAWQGLQQAAQTQGLSITELMAESRVQQYQINSCGIHLDYSKNRVDDEVLAKLLALAEQSPLSSLREAMVNGEAINRTEQRAVLHTALRASKAELQQRGLVELAAEIAEQQQRIKAVSDKLRAGEWRGATGKVITDVVNLGIGGSDLGPKLACEALKEFAHPQLRCHFVANVDGEVIRSTLKSLNPETTLVIIASKTFSTQETLLNARTAAHWFAEGLNLEKPFNSDHFIGVTASPQVACELGLKKDNLLLFWDWVGGRYSMWSSIGLPIAIAIGFENFSAMLAGAREMDQHFLQAPWRDNMPVMLALLGIWYSNFLAAETLAVIPYCERLGQFPNYLQQLDMESNGKGVSREGAPLSYTTGPIIWGLPGTNSQHSFFQLLHQGGRLIPVDFIGLVEDGLSSAEHHKVLLANMLAQSAALMAGKQADASQPHRHYPGNSPSNVLLLERLDPSSFGALVALYEHKVFVQGAIWNINSFDQWGVELGKVLAKGLLDPGLDKTTLDPSTRSLLARLAS